MFRIEDHSNWQSACRELAGRIERSRPLPGPGVRLEDTGGGRRISVIAGTGGGKPGYCGFFNVFLLEPRAEGELPSVLIADGAPDLTPEERLAAPAGIAVINDAIIDVPAMELPLNLERGLIWAIFELTDNGECRFRGYGSGGELPANLDEKIHLVLASFAGFGERPRLIQQHTGMLYGWIFRECGEAEVIG
ncbi:MAG: hypothetical protein AB7F32_06440 [Victivallaceae bacterium]